LPDPTDLADARIAIVMLSAIGDAVHTLPVVNSLRAAVPGVHLTWVIQPGPHALVANHPAVDEFIVFDRRRGVRAFREVRRSAAQRYDLVLGLQTYLKAGVLTAMLRSSRKLGLDRARTRDANWLFTTERVPPRGRRHIQDEYLEFLDYLGVPARLEWKLGPTEEERARFADALPPSERRTVSLVVGTSKPGKEWPAERYAALVDRLEGDLGVRTVLVGGRSERELATAAEIRRLVRHRPPLDLLEWDLRKLVYRLDRSDVLVSPDTGPLHIGVALGTPTVSLMGYTNPRRVGPYGRFQDLVIDAYGDPGEDYPVTGGYRPGRMERITPDAVVETVELALRRYPRTSPTGQSSP
jgi:heptosyltransferase I